MSTYLLTAVTILLAAGFAGLVFSNLGVDASPPHATFTLDAAPGSDEVTLTHAGGETVRVPDLRFTITIGDADASVQSTSKPGDAAAWRPGETLTLTLADAVPADATVTVRVHHAERGLVAAPSRSFAPAGAAADATPTLVDAAFGNGTAPRDGATPVTVRVNASTPSGLLLVTRVTLDLTPLGLSVTDLVDDGTLGDATPLDGRYARAFTVPPTASPGNHSLTLAASSATGARVTTTLVLEVVNATGAGGGGGGGSGGTGDGDGGTKAFATKATTGTAFSGIPTSGNMTALIVNNITWDHAAPMLLQNDILIMKITDPEHDSWTVMIVFDPVSGELGLKEIVMYNANGGCSWAPKGYRITGPLDLLDPTTVDGLGTGSGTSSMIPSGIPQGCDEVEPDVRRASYKNAGVDDPATLTILRLGENTGADEKTAVIHADVDYR